MLSLARQALSDLADYRVEIVGFSLDRTKGSTKRVELVKHTSVSCTIRTIEMSKRESWEERELTQSSHVFGFPFGTNIAAGDRIRLEGLEFRVVAVRPNRTLSLRTSVLAKHEES